jgi:hypothetical protein
MLDACDGGCVAECRIIDALSARADSSPVRSRSPTAR